MMRVLPWLVVLVLLAPAARADRHKLSIDPETKAGFVLQQIKQERSAAKKLDLIVQFVAEFPKDENTAWVLEQLLPARLEAKDFEKALEAGEQLLALDPADVDAASQSLKAAEETKKPELVRKFAALAWKTSDRILQAGKPKDLSAGDWSKQADFCRSLRAYSEYAIFALANGVGEERRAEVFSWLEQLNPQSIYLAGAKAAPSMITATSSPAEAAAQATEILQKDPTNVDALAVLADRAIQANDHASIMALTEKLIDALAGPKPENFSDEDWKLRQERYLFQSLWSNGIISSMRGNYHRADRSLRAVLPFVRSNPQMLSTALYHLGYVNYQLAEKGEPNRVFEAIRFNQECSQIKSNYQDQAVKNIASIKSEFNLP